MRTIPYYPFGCQGASVNFLSRIFEMTCPKPFRQRHGCRPNRTPATGRRDRRQSIGPPQPFPSPKRARQAKPSASHGCGLPLVQPPRRFLPPRRTRDTAEAADTSPSATPASASSLDAGLPAAQGQRRRGEEARRVFRARRGWRRAGSPHGADAEAKASGSIHLANATSAGARKSSERAAPRAATQGNQFSSPLSISE